MQLIVATPQFSAPKRKLNENNITILNLKAIFGEDLREALKCQRGCKINHSPSERVFIGSRSLTGKHQPVYYNAQVGTVAINF
jgi:hypothetical protein